MTVSATARELTVSGTAPSAYRTVQAAIDALPDKGGDIAIAPGTYREKLSVTKNGVHLRGTGKAPGDVVLVYGDAAATVGSTFRSATLSASGDDFRLRNLTVQNDYWLDPAHPPSQAVALMVTGDRDVFERVRLLGHQDTLYANKGPGGRMARQLFRDCYIEGHVDFIFGNAKAYFQRCDIRGLAHGQVMFTAQSRKTADEDSAYVFDDCRLTAEPGAQNVSLGRPWRPYATVVFLDTRMGAPIIRDGWSEWHPGETNSLPTTYYAEYRSTGPGASPTTREPHSHQLTAAEAARWRLPAFFAGDTQWIRRTR
ncbi:MAG: pectin esterase [Sphingomonas sp.]|nr:MAG: pectin esterase [Sphingomonas sp.]